MLLAGLADEGEPSLDDCASSGRIALPQKRMRTFAADVGRPTKRGGRDYQAGTSASEQRGNKNKVSLYVFHEKLHCLLLVLEFTFGQHCAWMSHHRSLTLLNTQHGWRRRQQQEEWEQQEQQEQRLQISQNAWQQHLWQQQYLQHQQHASHLQVSKHRGFVGCAGEEPDGRRFCLGRRELGGAAYESSGGGLNSGRLGARGMELGGLSDAGFGFGGRGAGFGSGGRGGAAFGDTRVCFSRSAGLDVGGLCGSGLGYSGLGFNNGLLGTSLTGAGGGGGISGAELISAGLVPGLGGSRGFGTGFVNQTW